MTKKMIKEFMSPKPITIDVDNNLAYAISIMHDNKLRHLPVLQDKKVVGVLSEGDIRLMQSFAKEHLSELGVSEAYSSEPYTAQSEDSINAVSKSMWEKRCSSALIMENGDLVGIFTWIDALKALSEN